MTGPRSGKDIKATEAANDVTSVLTLVRHGQTRANAEGRWEGRRDGPLTTEGRRQVEGLGGRAVETAQLLLPRWASFP